MVTECIVSLLHRYKAKTLLLAGALLFAGAIGITSIVIRADQRLRTDLLTQVRLVAGAVDVTRLTRLSGSTNDLESTAYLQLKAQLASIHAHYPQSRFVYILGRKQDRSVFFYVDSEHAGSAQESPAGQPYEEASVLVHDTFDTGHAVIDGPTDDRWGRWVSALIPLFDPTTNTLIAVFGIDIDARDWQWNVFAQAAPPAGLIAIMMLGLIAIPFIIHQTNPTPKTVMRRLMPAMAVLLLILIGGGCGMLIKALEQQMNSVSLVLKHVTASDLKSLLDEQTRVLLATQDLILQDPAIAESLRKGDRDRLFALMVPIFTTLKTSQHITHCFFSDTNRTCVLRLHKPDKYGDRIDRLTTREVERTQQPAFGIELGALGTMPLRVVHPVFDAKHQLVGYMELAKELSDALNRIVKFDGVEKIQMVDKSMLERTSWEAGMDMLGRKPNWDLLPNHVVIYSTIVLPKEITHLLDIQNTSHDIIKEVFFNNKYWRIVKETLPDVTGTAACELIFLYDVTNVKTAQRQQVIVAGTLSTILFIAVFLLIFVMLHRTDTSIRLQQATLLEFKTAVMQASEGIAMSDCNGIIRFINTAWAHMHGCTPEEAIGKPIAFFHTEEQLHQEVNPAIKRLLTEGTCNRELNHARKDGAIFPTRMSVSLITQAHGKPLGFLGIACDITAEVQQREKEKHDTEIRTCIVDVSARFMQVNDPAHFDTVIQYTLATFGQCLHMDRCTYIRFSEDLAYMTTAQDWHRPGVTLPMEGPDEQPTESTPWWMAQMRDLKITCIPNLGTLPAAASIEKQALLIQGLQSSLSLPIHSTNTRLAGAFVFDATQPSTPWSPEQIDMFRVLMDIVSSAITRIDVLQALTASKKQYETLFHEMLDGFALQEILCNPQGIPVDYRFIDVNPAFERMTGLRAENILQRTVLEILPKTEPYWIETYGRVVITGEPISFEQYSSELGKYFEVHAFCPAPKQFACIFQDISSRKHAEEDLKKRYHELERINRVTVGRELRMIELKTEINRLMRAQGQPEKYKIVGGLHDSTV